MTDITETVINTIERIREYCRIHNCEDCIFRNGPYECQVTDLMDVMAVRPVAWDMKKIRYIARKP